MLSIYLPWDFALDFIWRIKLGVESWLLGWLYLRIAFITFFLLSVFIWTALARNKHEVLVLFLICKSSILLLQIRMIISFKRTLLAFNNHFGLQLNGAFNFRIFEILIQTNCVSTLCTMFKFSIYWANWAVFVCIVVTILLI